MKILNEKPDSIPLREMKDAEIGVTTEWGISPQYIGLVVQRYKDSLVVIGMEYGRSWPFFLDTPEGGSDKYRVRSLPAGTHLEIEY